MDAVRINPGPNAAHAFRLGVMASALLGLVGIGLLYWIGILEAVIAGYLLVVIFPVYLVFVTAVLSRWLGYDKDITSLRPVYRPKE